MNVTHRFTTNVCFIPRLFARIAHGAKFDFTFLNYAVGQLGQSPRAHDAHWFDVDRT